MNDYDAMMIGAGGAGLSAMSLPRGADRWEAIGSAAVVIASGDWGQSRHDQGKGCRSFSETLSPL